MTQTRTPSGRAGAQTGRTGTRPPPRRLEPRGSVRLTGRGAILALFGVCFLSLLLAAWTGWSAVADAAFVMVCGTVAYYTRPNELRKIVVSPPLAFFAGCGLAQLVTAAGGFATAEGILVTLGEAAPWLFTGTALTIVIALVRGYRPRLPGFAALVELRQALGGPGPGPGPGPARSGRGAPPGAKPRSGGQRPRPGP
jgi:hypothetical protein